MKSMKTHSKIFMFVMDIIIISLAAIIANLLLCQENQMFTKDNIQIMINSIILSVLIYEIYLNIFKIYKHITRFESGRDYLTYILICLISGTTLIFIKEVLHANINSCRRQILCAFLTMIGLLSTRIVIRFFLNSIMQEKENSNGKKDNILIIGAGYAGKDIIRSINKQ